MILQMHCMNLHIREHVTTQCHGVQASTLNAIHHSTRIEDYKNHVMCHGL